MKLVATKISPDWFERLEALTEETGLTQSAILREAIGQYLGIEKVNLVSPVNELRSEIEDLKARVTVLEGKTALSNSCPVSKEITQLVMDNPVSEVKPSPRPTSSVKSSTSPTGALLTGQLHNALELRGYSKKRRTLENALQKAQKLGALSEDLVALGVRADFEARAADPRNSALRWLFLD